MKFTNVSDGHGCQSVYCRRSLGAILILIPNVSVTIEINFNDCLKNVSYYTVCYL